MTTNRAAAHIDMTHDDPVSLRLAVLRKLESSGHITFVRVAHVTETVPFASSRAASVRLDLTKLEVAYSGGADHASVSEMVDEWIIANELGTLSVGVIRLEADMKTPMSYERQVEIEGERARAESQYARARMFRQCRARLEALRRLNNSGVDVYDHMNTLAQTAVSHFNAHAQALAKRFNRRPQTITVSSLLRN